MSLSPDGLDNCLRVFAGDSCREKWIGCGLDRHAGGFPQRQAVQPNRAASSRATSAAPIPTRGLSVRRSKAEMQKATPGGGPSA